MRAQMLCNMPAAPILRSQLNWPEPGNVVLIVKHKSNRARFLVDAEWRPRQNDAFEDDAIYFFYFSEVY